MKNISKVFIILIILLSLSFADSITGFGIKMGIVATDYEQKIIIGDHESSITLYDDTRIGPSMGIYIRYLDYKFIDFESELLYMQKGGQDKYEITTLSDPDGTGEIIIYDIHFDYLQFQTGVQPKTMLYNIGLYGLLGCSFNYLLQIRNGIRPLDRFNRFAFAYYLGTGLEFNNILEKPILLEFILNNDLTNIHKNSASEFKFQTYIFRIGFGI